MKTCIPTQVAPESVVGEGAETGETHPLETMSEREMEILALVAEGCTNQDIAVRLAIAHGTVRTHLYHIFRKLCVRRRTEAAVKYLTATDALERISERRRLQ
jgi:DNA-binding NarL/FixJ family response regulator